MSYLTLAEVGQDGSMSNLGPREGGPTRRRSFTPAQKLGLLSQYERECETRDGGAFLREQGLFSSQVTEWRKLRDAGVLEGKKPGDSIGQLTREQAEIARLRRQLEVSESRLKRSEAALDVMGKLHDLLESLSEGSKDEPTSKKP